MDNFFPIIMIFFVFIFTFFSIIGKILTAILKRFLSGETSKETKNMSKTASAKITSNIGLKIREVLAQIQRELEAAKNRAETERNTKTIPAEWEKVGWKNPPRTKTELEKRQIKTQLSLKTNAPNIAEKKPFHPQKSVPKKSVSEKSVSEKSCSFPYANYNINNLQRAFVWSEILGKPLALREKNRQDINSLPSNL